MPAPAMPYFSVPFDDVQPVADGDGTGSRRRPGRRDDGSATGHRHDRESGRCGETTSSFADMKALLIGAGFGAAITSSSLSTAAIGCPGHRDWTRNTEALGTRGRTGRASRRGGAPTRARPRRGRPSCGRSRRPPRRDGRRRDRAAGSCAGRTSRRAARRRDQLGELVPANDAAEAVRRLDVEIDRERRRGAHLGELGGRDVGGDVDRRRSEAVEHDERGRIRRRHRDGDLPAALGGQLAGRPACRGEASAGRCPR